MKTRTARVADRIREDITSLLMRGGLRHPGLEGVIVTRVEMTDDLQSARVYVRLLSLETPKAAQENVVRLLAQALPTITREVGAKLGLRRIPNFRFYWDDSVEKVARIESLLQEIAEEKKAETRDDKSDNETPSA